MMALTFSDVGQQFASVPDAAINHPVIITRCSAPDMLVPPGSLPSYSSKNLRVCGRNSWAS
ncbi:hypothetical protein [Erwinia mallotivora]|nr:hypothetical protein [Erwinia mallotivora]